MSGLTDIVGLEIISHYNKPSRRPAEFARWRGAIGIKHQAILQWNRTVTRLIVRRSAKGKLGGRSNSSCRT